MLVSYSLSLYAKVLFSSEIVKNLIKRRDYTFFFFLNKDQHLLPVYKSWLKQPKSTLFGDLVINNLILDKDRYLASTLLSDQESSSCCFQNINSS